MHIEDHDPLDRLQEAAKGHRNTRTWPRVQAIILAKQGDTAAQIARALGVSRRAVQAWAAAYNRGGLEALPDRPHPGRTPILPRDQEARFRERMEAPPRPEDGVCELRGADIRRILDQEFAARYTLDGVYKLLHRLGYSDLMPRPRHPETPPGGPGVLQGGRRRADRGDRGTTPRSEGRGLAPGRGPVRPEGLAHPGVGAARVAPRRVRQDGRESLYVLTAVCAASGAAVGLVMPELNTAVVNLFLEEFSRRLAPGVHAVLLWDNAGYHTSGGLVVPENVSLIGLLPYSPELNPVENLWHYLRSHHWSHRVYQDYEALRDAAAESWRAVCLDPEKIRTDLRRPAISNEPQMTFLVRMRR